ncbi:MAG TPA: hypothetical protein VHM25_04150 [Polyangiaceae bacterium]|nr:hypothetical protein [Polyangiaceae bacterium]
MIKKVLAAGLLLAAVQGCGSDSDGTSNMPETTGKGPGAVLKCTSSGKNAWDTYGAAAFVAVNESIFDLVLADTSGELGDSFSKIGSGDPPSTVDDAATFKGKLAAFLVYAYGGPTSIKYTDGKTYTGPQNMALAHAGLGITEDQYNYFIMNQVVPALTMNGVPEKDVTSCFAPVVTDSAFVASIVGK